MMTDIKETKAVTEAMDSVERLRKVVKTMYKNGNDNRSQKNGNPDSLVDIVRAVEHISTCGVYDMLGLELQTYVNDEDRRKEGEVKCLKTIAQFILRLEKEGSTEVYIKMSEKGRTILDEFIKTERFIGRDVRNVFNVDKVFRFQERQKVTPELVARMRRNKSAAKKKPAK